MRVNISHEILRIPSGTLNAYKANLTGFLGELFVDCYLLNKYPLLQDSTLYIKRRQVSSSGLRNLFYGDFAPAATFIPHVLDRHTRRVLWLPKGTRMAIEEYEEVRYLRVYAPPEDFESILPLLEKDPLFKQGDFEDEIQLRNHVSWRYFRFEIPLSIRAKVYVLFSNVDNMKEVIEAIEALRDAGLKIIDYAVLKGQVKRITKEDEYHLEAEGDVKEIELYEVKSGKQVSRRGFVNQILEEVKDILKNVKGGIKVSFKLITIPFELDIPRMVRLEIFEVT